MECYSIGFYVFIEFYVVVEMVCLILRDCSNGGKMLRGVEVVFGSLDGFIVDLYNFGR